MGVLPAYIVMRVGAQWTESAENFPDDYDPAWLGIGYITADAGALLVLDERHPLRSGCASCAAAAASGSRVPSASSRSCCSRAYVVAVWAMSGKPT